MRQALSAGPSQGCSRRPRGLAVILVVVVGDIQVDFIGQADDLTRDIDRLGVKVNQVDIPRPAQQVFFIQQGTAQISRQQIA